MVSFKGFHENYIKELAERVAVDIDWLSYGNAKTYDEYQKVCGQVRARRDDISRYQELIDNMENADD